jgi:small basic protein
MSFKKLATLDSQPFHDLARLLSLPVRSGISLVLNLTTQAGVFEGLFESVFSNLEREYSMGEVFVSGFFVDRLRAVFAVVYILS